jgi:hypothetical protein
MTSILSYISGQFSKSLILGTLLPVVLFLILGMIFVVPLFPYDWQFLKQLLALDSQTVVVFTFITIVLSGLLYSFNAAIRNYYEGYPWQFTWVGQWRIRRYKSELLEKQSFMSRTMKLRNELRDRDGEKYADLIDKIEDERTIKGREINDKFPSYPYLVLPTRLGNIIRSFESYPLGRYNIDSIALWPRLRAKLDKEYATALDDAKTPLDFMINISVLSALLSLSILVVGLFYPIPFASQRVGIWWGLQILFFAFASYLAYRLAIIQTWEWGNMFKGAFDLYRWDLLKQLGYKRVPGSMTEERALWGDIRRQIIYGDPPVTHAALLGTVLGEYANVNTVAYGRISGEAYSVGLQTARGVSLPDDTGVSTVTLSVKNVDGQERLAKNIIVRDTLPEDFEYLWDSASAEGSKIIVSGANPYYFEIGNLHFNEEKKLTYSALQRKK